MLSLENMPNFGMLNQSLFNMDIKQIEDFRVESLDNGSHFAYHTTVVGWAKADTHVAAKFPTFINPYDTALGEEDRVIKTSPKNMLTDDIAASDQLRDELYRSYRDIVKAMDGIAIPEMAAAAKILQQHIKDYRINVYAQLDKETGNLLNFTNDLKGKYAEQVAALNLTNIVEKLAEANEQTAELLRQRDIANKNREVGATKRARGSVDKAYRNLIQMVNAHALVEGEADYADFIDQVNSLIRRYRQQVLGQTSGSKTPDEEDEPTPEPVTPAITAVYQKEGGDPENPHRIERGEQTGVNYKGFTLKGQDGTLEHVIGLVNDQDYIEWINPETITNVTETSCEFTMVPDLTEGQYKVRIETYDGGSPLVVEYPEPITLW